MRDAQRRLGTKRPIGGTLPPEGDPRVREEVDGPPGETRSVLCQLGDIKVYLYKRDKVVNL